MELERRHCDGGGRERALLMECLRGEPGEVLRRVPGRETFLVEGSDGVAWVVKRYSGGARAAGGARREFEALEELARAGLAVPPAVACLEQGGVGVLAMKHVVHEQSLREALAVAEGGERALLLERLLGMVLGLHTRGWHHRDLYLHHVLVDERGELVLIDLGRARRLRWTRRRWFAKDLAALLLWTPSEVSECARLRFLARYMDGMEMLSRRERRRFALDIVRRRARLARHRPRHGEAGAWEGGA